MQRWQQYFISLFLLVWLMVIPSSHASSISDIDKYAWSENTGWLNFSTSGGNVSIYPDHLGGYVWADNIGWIRLGTYPSGGNHSYVNTSNTNYGVNRASNGSLSGYAWSENVGWINFGATGGNANIAVDGTFSGYAWGDNIGWIKLAGIATDNIAYGVKSAALDTTAPTLAEVAAVPTPANDTTPNYTFSSDETGAISYGGDCSSATTTASIGNNTITFNTLATGTHSNCTVRVTDAAGNASTALAISAFTIDTSAPTLAAVTAVPTPGNDTTPNYTFSSNEAGAISYGGDCSSATTSASVGNNTITFNTLAAGTHSNCTVRVTDAAGNASTALAVSAFTIDTTAPTLVEVAPVPTPGNDTTPNYVFSSNLSSHKFHASAKP